MWPKESERMAGLSLYLTDRPEYDEDRVNLIQLILNNPKIGVEVSDRDTQGNDTTLSALNNDNKYKLDTEYTIQ